MNPLVEYLGIQALRAYDQEEGVYMLAYITPISVRVDSIQIYNKHYRLALCSALPFLISFHLCGDWLHQETDTLSHHPFCL